MLGEAASPEVERRIVEAMEGGDNVCRVIHIRTEHLGPEELLVAAKLEFDGDLSIRELADVINEVEAAVRKEVPEARVIYLEPDVVRSGLTMASLDESAKLQLQALGDFIRHQRHMAELSLRDLAARTNVSNPYLSQIERGLHEPSVRVLKAIATALNVSAESLLTQAGLLEGEAEAGAATTATSHRATTRTSSPSSGPRCSPSTSRTSKPTPPRRPSQRRRRRCRGPSAKKPRAKARGSSKKS